MLDLKKTLKYEDFPITNFFYFQFPNFPKTILNKDNYEKKSRLMRIVLLALGQKSHHIRVKLVFMHWSSQSASCTVQQI